MAVTQQERRFEITSPLGDDVLLFRRMTGEERLGQLFRYDAEFLSEDHNIALADLLGQNITIRYDLADGETTRYFNGFVSQFHYEGISGGFARYRAEIRPWLWFLTRVHDCRIFQTEVGPRYHRTGFSRSRIHRLRPTADWRPRAVGILRPISGIRLQFRLPPHGTGRNLFLLRT